MVLAAKDNLKKREYWFLVHHSIVKNLSEISKNAVRLRMTELLKKYEDKHKEELTYFITVQNEIVLERKTCRGIDYIGEKMPRGWTGMDDLVRKMDFSDVLHKDVIHYSDRVISDDQVGDYDQIHFYCEFPEGSGESEGQTLEILEKYVGSRVIPNFFEKVPWELKTYTGTIANIYDPSKFWVRFAEVDLLQNHLWNFYNMRKNDYVLSPSDMRIGLNCAVFVDEAYYRGRVVKMDIVEANWFVVYLYDHAKMHKLHRNCLFKLHEKFGIFPEFAVRCSLASVSPLDHETWTSQAVDRFMELAKEDKKLIVKLSRVNQERKILDVYLVDSAAKDRGTMHTFNQVLVDEKLAKGSWEEPVKAKKNRPFLQLREYTYLYPTHEMIESGAAPSSFSLTEKLKKCVAWDVLFPELYKYQG